MGNFVSGTKLCRSTRDWAQNLKKKKQKPAGDFTLTIVNINMLSSQFQKSPSRHLRVRPCQRSSFNKTNKLNKFVKVVFQVCRKLYIESNMSRFCFVF